MSYQDTSIESENYLVSLIISCKASASHIPLSANDFTQTDNREIWLIAEQLESSGQPANILTICDQLKEKNLAPPLADWNLSLNTFANDFKFMKSDKQSISNAVTKIKQASIDFKVRQIGGELTKNPKMAGQAIQMLLEATSNNTIRNSTTLNDGVRKALAEFHLLSKEHNPTGALSGLSDLDEKTGGFQKTDFVIVGARSAQGKTAFALTCMQNAIKDGRYTGIISVEMPDTQLGMRHIASNSGVDLKKVRNGTATETEWVKIAHGIKAVSVEERKRLLINDWTNDWDVIKTQIRTWAQNHDMSGGVWIDYLQNLKIVRAGRTMEKVQEAMAISYECKALAKELNIPIIGLSQLQRDIDNKKDKRPTKANLSWASQFENDADLILLLYRHEVYEKDNYNAKGVAEIIIDKFRNGETSTEIVCFRGSRMDFVDLEENAKNQYINSLNIEKTPKKPVRRDY